MMLVAFWPLETKTPFELYPKVQLPAAGQWFVSSFTALKLFIEMQASLSPQALFKPVLSTGFFFAASDRGKFGIQKVWILSAL